jgi:sortase A
VRVGKLLSVIMVLAMVMTLAACGGSEQGQNPPDEPVAPKGPAKEHKRDNSANAPSDTTLKITVPKMQRIKDVPVPDTSGEDEEALKNYAGIHLEGTGFPWDEEANVYIAGHRLGYPGTPSFLAFYDIDKVKENDELTVTDADGKEYTYRVFKAIEVEPTDLYVTEPMPGRNIVTLQSCTLPDYARRVIVQAELEA